MMNRADTAVLHDEARKALKEALTSYQGDPTHVTIYVLDLQMDRNSLLSSLSMTDQPSDAAKVKRMVEAVDAHLEEELRDYLGIK